MHHIQKTFSNTIESHVQDGVAGAVSNGLSSFNFFLGLADGENDDSTLVLAAKFAALEAAKGKANTSAAQRIQLDQKISDARAAMVKAQRDADTELSVLV